MAAKRIRRCCLIFFCFAADARLLAASLEEDGLLVTPCAEDLRTASERSPLLLLFGLFGYRVANIVSFL